MSIISEKSWNWVRPKLGANPIHQGLDSEMFDRSDYRYSETLVREAIQNSLDARRDPEKPVIVKFTFRSGNSDCCRPFLEQLIAYREKTGQDIPSEWGDGRIHWLVVEDFNSKGLCGDLSNRTSDFWNYWLNFGVSNKDGAGRGGRGIGRVTFLISSRLQSVIGYTRRFEDGKSAICGMAVLKARVAGSNLESTHAYLAENENGNIYSLYDSKEFHDSMCNAFAFTGYDGEYDSGLGLAIPYPHENLNKDGILAAAIENFAPAIMDGSLVLAVNDRELDRSSIWEIAPAVAENLRDERIKANVIRYLSLVKLAQTEASPNVINLPNASKDDFTLLRETSDIKAFQEKVIDEDVVLKIVFPLARNGATKDVSLRAVIGPSAQEAKKPVDHFFREGMSLPGVKTKPSEFDLVTLVKKGELATYLNFCEGKAHLDLLESEEVKQKLRDEGFSDNLHVRRLVKSLPTELRRLLTPDAVAPDPYVFEHYFSVPLDKPGKKKKPTKPIGPPVPPPPPRIPVFKAETLDDGLIIKANDDYTDWPVNIEITLAYADGTRNAFLSWSPFDFEFNNLCMWHTDCELISSDNKVKALNCGPDTEIRITGFDRNRELETRIRRLVDA